MSLAVLARKTKAKQRLKTRGKFILNMTGRGNVLGMNAKMSRGNCKGLTTCAGKRAACCAGVPNVRLPTRPTQTNTMVVGNTGNVYGFALATTPNIGSFTPQTINGVGISPPDGEVTYLNGTISQVFSVVLPTGGLPQSFFTSISFVDGCNVRTYRTSEASSFGNVGGTRWEWNAAASGYTAAEEVAYWSGNNGKSLDVYVTDSTNNTIVPTPENLCPSQCCEFPHGGQPAPQMGYRVYLNRKSKGAYRPAGGKQCKTLSGCTSAKSVWKQGSNLDAGEITRKRRDNTLACYTDVYTAKKDTCTGCPDKGPVLFGGTQTNTMVVGNTGNVYGFALATTPNIGSFTPQTINGVGISPPDGEVTYLNGTVSQVFSVVLPTGGLPQSFFTSISFVDGCNVRTYRTSEASSFGNVGGTRWEWNAAASGYTAAEEAAYWSGNNGKSLAVYVTDSTNNTVIPFCRLCCCPVKKNICGCRATDLVRYTRINKSFGCQTTKAVRMGRTASEQIARRRAAVDCIAPKHRTIYFEINSVEQLVISGCCGNQCLIQGQQYNFNFNSPNNAATIKITWCAGLVETINIPQNKSSFSFTVPKFNKNCQPATEAVVEFGSSSIRLSYCKKAFKTPQMLGSCSGR